MKKQRWFWGFFFILSGILIIVSKLNLIPIEISAWSLFFTIFFVATTIQSILHKNVFGTLFSLAFLAIIYAKPLGIQAITPWTLLATTLLISIGISMVYRPKKNIYKNCSKKAESLYGNTNMQYEQSNDGFYKMHTNLNSSTRYIHTDDFKGADIRCRLGSMKIYFDQANIQGNHADIYLDIELSSVELFFPKTWKIEKNFNQSMSGCNEDELFSNEATIIEAAVTLHGSLTTSGLDIHYI